jgi:hypothetical protein
MSPIAVEPLCPDIPVKGDPIGNGGFQEKGEWLVKR